MAEGSQLEHERIVAHLAFAEKFGVVEIALRAIDSGAGMTAEIASRYMMAARSQAEIRLRQEECDEAAAIIAGMRPTPSGYRDELGEAIFARLKELVGVDEGDA